MKNPLSPMMVLWALLLFILLIVYYVSERCVKHVVAYVVIAIVWHKPGFIENRAYWFIHIWIPGVGVIHTYQSFKDMIEGNERIY